jgi:TonB family protein
MNTAWKALLILLLCAATVPAPSTGQTESPQLEPVEVVSAEPASYPPNTVASGTVILEVTVSAAGEIEHIRVVRDIPPLTQAAERALRQWKFRPAKLNGTPVRATMTAAFSFVPPVLNPARPRPR